MQNGIRYNTYQGIKYGVILWGRILCLVGIITIINSGILFAQPQDTSCVGPNGYVNWYYYNGVDGNYLPDLYAYPYFPQVPSGNLILYSLQSPYKFNEYFGSMANGFIKPPETGDYIFNVTADNQIRFFLSDGTDPENMIPLCESTWDWIDHHENDSTQTSDTFHLVADRYYYFEFHHKERTSTDHAQVYWKTPFYPDSVWTLVHGAFLYENLCMPICDPFGTPCDDGDSLTTNDIMDGFCNCYGSPPKFPVEQADCIGERSTVTALYYDTIGSSNINNLYAAAKFPLKPDRSDILDRFSIPVDQAASYGTMLKGYLNVPVEGWYQFNVTSDDYSEVYMKNHQGTDSLYMIAHLYGWSEVSDHYKYPSQTSDSIYLYPNMYYMIQMNHKEGGGGDNLDLFWRTPFIQDTGWTAISPAFIYQYNCEDACIPQGTPCNDGDPNTRDDQYDADCNCVGTPCGGPCEEQPDYVAYESCAPTDKHSNHEFDSWLSCAQDTNPNPTHGMGHWILYDFGESYKFLETRVWNYNVEGQTGKGAKTVAVDISEDGIEWQELGEVQWQEADGTNSYEGELLTILDSLSTRYLLLTIIETWDPDTCAGFSEIVFTVGPCPDAGIACDDGDPNTFGDMYDQYCDCRGLPLPINHCDTNFLYLNNPTLKSGLYTATDSIHADGVSEYASQSTLVAGQSITLLPGFEVELGSAFLADVQPCFTPPTPISPFQVLTHPFENQGTEPKLVIYQKLGDSWATVYFSLDQATKLSLYVVSPTGEHQMDIVSNVEFSPGMYEKRIPVQNIEEGIYSLMLETPTGTTSKRLVVKHN